MSDFKVGDRVRVLPGVARPFVGLEGTICEVRPHDQGIETMARHFVIFSRREKLSFYSRELTLVPKQKS
jgi:transcription antitermination factor NusG